MMNVTIEIILGNWKTENHPIFLNALYLNQLVVKFILPELPVSATVSK